jgi:hypothetical protein
VEAPQLLESLVRSYRPIMGRRTVRTEAEGVTTKILGDDKDEVVR